jgi:hypothetical protein
MFNNNLERLIWLLGIFGLALIFKSCPAHAGGKELQAYALKLGFKPSTSLTTAIASAAKAYGQDEKELLAIAIIESRLNPKATGYNDNGTIDIGAFQINERTAASDCEQFNVYNVKGNAYCAAFLLAGHKKTGDFYYVGRYHNAKPKLKMNYYYKVKGVR